MSGKVKNIKFNIDKTVVKVKKSNKVFNQCRNWCFTDFELLDWKSIFENNQEYIRYICFGKEICPKTEKVHYQGWIQLSKLKTLGGVKKLANSKAIHLECCKGDEFDNDKYCTKDGNYIKLGNFITQGNRSDLHKIKDDIFNGKKLVDVLKDDPISYCKYRNGIRDMSSYYNQESTKEFRKVEVILLHGKTASGKTRKAMEEATYKINGDDLAWWDGYDGDKCICIDEYDNNIPITKLLNILDGYQLRLNIKGSHTYANWNKVYITSNLELDEIHSQAKPEHRRALFRRISKIYEIKNGTLIQKNNDIGQLHENTKSVVKVLKGNTDFEYNHNPDFGLDF